MSDFIYWVVISAIGIIATSVFLGVKGGISIACICVLGGLMQILENKLHPHIYERTEDVPKK